MPQIEVIIDAENKPANLPTPEVIIEQCRIHSSAQRTAINTHGVRLILDDGIYYWVKFGRTITMDEAQTQNYVAGVLNCNPDATVRVPCVYLAFQWGRFGYMVMEYIHGKMCDDSDADLVAAAVQSLIDIKSPTLEPGPVGGGIIHHPFFIDRTASIRYDSVKQLEDHINGILCKTKRSERVRFKPEVASYGLRLCPADLNTANFMKDEGDRIVALDFGATCFLPPSFFALVLYNGDTNLTQLIAKKVKYPESTEVNAMLAASFALVPFGTNEIGVPHELKSRSR
ncbi:hypothetical protein BDN72DRAFT_619183 [Pluteus cervinus]|uniref:Uncharacterized protein n=1 Tax=Pluteus cervinus TaxID=181527 RepID=A0ACD3AVK5_9AGAR|nr:hypothetical protein BDN72DRAFT_619183 [Pluteus cervinus]